MKFKVSLTILTIFNFAVLFSCNTMESTVSPPNIDVDEKLELFYYSKRNGVNNIYKSDLKGNEIPIIVDQSSHDWWVRVSPNKQIILWYKSPLNVASNNEFNNYEEAALWMANIDGTNPHKVIDLADYGWSAQGVADWSPNGTKLVMAAKKSNFWQIYSTDNNGKDPMRISQDANKDYADPSWSPDGEKIVFSKYVGLNLEIHIMNKDGSNEIQLTDDDAYQNYDAYWSPDGKEIAFESKWSILDCFLLGKWAIRKYNFDTGLTTDVIKDNNRNGLARWTKDSKKIYFSISVCGKYAKLARMDRNGDNLEIILQDANFPFYDCDLYE
jgi:Tol biopolymer transport system component